MQQGSGFNCDDAPAGTALAALSGLARVGSFGCEELASTVLRIKSSASHFRPERIGRPTLQTGTHGPRGVRDVLLAILPVTRVGSSPALPVVCNMFDRHEGREDEGRVARTSGRRELCRRDHARRGSPDHIDLKFFF
jgi:hypothetical protein